MSSQENEKSRAGKASSFHLDLLKLLACEARAVKLSVKQEKKAKSAVVFGLTIDSKNAFSLFSPSDDCY